MTEALSKVQRVLGFLRQAVVFSPVREWVRRVLLWRCPFPKQKICPEVAGGPSVRNGSDGKRWERRQQRGVPERRKAIGR